jgi:hypothetical protein
MKHPSNHNKSINDLKNLLKIKINPKPKNFLSLDLFFDENQR